MGWAVAVLRGLAALPGLIRTGKEVVKEFMSERPPKPLEVPPPSTSGGNAYVRGYADAKDQAHQREVNEKMTAAARDNLSPWNPDGSPKE